MVFTEESLVAVNQRLLEAIADGDWNTYQELCDPTLTAIEPESEGLVVEGLGFHKFYFDLGGVRGKHKTTVHKPHVQIVSETGILGYVRLVQCLDENGRPRTVANAETRIWKWTGSVWLHVHFHRTPLAAR